MISSGADGKEPDLKTRHATDSHFRNVITITISSLVDKSQTYNKNMAARTINYTKRLKMFMEPY